MTTNNRQNATYSNDNVHLRIADAWLAKGNLQVALTYFQQALEIDPLSSAAHLGIGRIMLAQGDKDAARASFEQALASEPDNHRIKTFYAAVQNEWHKMDAESLSSGALMQSQQDDLLTVPRKICLSDNMVINYHRSGWKYALETLSPLHNPEGVLFDGFLEYNFLAQHFSVSRSAAQLEQLKQHSLFETLATSEEKGLVPYKRPWVGFIHFPPNMPLEFAHYAQYHLTQMFAKSIWMQSIEHCLGLFTLSEYCASWLRRETALPVSVLTFPTEIPDAQFDMRMFRKNGRKKIVQIGWWLRHLDAIYQLPLPKNNPLNYTKAWLMPRGNQEAIQDLLACERARQLCSVDSSYMDNTEVLSFVPNREYDQLLSENLVFVDLYDSSANNAIVESIARATPILVNPLPAVIEYLGPDYPFYFESLSEAAEKALDLDLIEETHEYLKRCPTRAKFDRAYFFESFVNSEVYRSISS